MTTDLSPPLMHHLDGSAGGVALFDADDRLRWANAWFRDAWGPVADAQPTWDELLRHGHRDGVGMLIDAPDVDAWIAGARVQRRGTPVRAFESELVDGRWIWNTESVGPEGWLTWQCTDITALRATEITLRRLREEAAVAARTDALTGLPNRRAMLRRAHDELDHAHAMRLPLCVALIDIDHFKRINDFHGHDAGDRVLTSFARTLKRHRRRVDVAGRIGGGEFLLLLPNVTLDGAAATLARLRSDVEASFTTVRRGELPVEPHDFSAGITQARYGDTIDSLLRRADLALTQAKDAGRACDATLAPEADNTFGWSASTQSAMLSR